MRRWIQEFKNSRIQEFKNSKFSYRTSFAAVDHNIIAVGSTGREGRSSPADVLKIAGVLRSKNIIRHENAAVIHHAGNVGHSSRLLNAVVIHKCVVCELP